MKPSDPIYAVAVVGVAVALFPSLVTEALSLINSVDLGTDAAAGGACWSPWAKFAAGCVVLSHLSMMEKRCQYWTIVVLVLASMTVGKSSWDCTGAVAAKAIGVVTLLSHGPMMPRKCWNSSVALAVAYSAAEYTGFGGEKILAVASVLLALVVGARALKLSLTLKATAPITLFIRFASHIVPRYAFSEEEFLNSDGASAEIVERRRKAFVALKEKWDVRYPESMKVSATLKKNFSDLRFASSNRVFVPFQKVLSTWCDPCTVVEETDRMMLKDIDGEEMIDIAGSYGVNVCGYDRYKQWLTEGMEMVRNLGCVLGPVHPLLLENIAMLRDISKKEEVSFHMSGTEAVMAAIRLARFNKKRQKVVLFGGAYHGWWDGVQASAGNERTAHDVLTLTDLSPASLDVIRCRASEIAAVVVNPLQSFHPNTPPPSDLVLASNVRNAKESVAYREYLQAIRKVCDEHDVVFIMDEVYTGFRLAPGGAQEYFGVQADMVVYGKTLGGGMPNGIVCGPSELMVRGEMGKPLRVNYVIGTFSAHPLLLATMNLFLKWVTTPEARAEFETLQKNMFEFVVDVNQECEEKGIPLGCTSYASVWTLLYRQPGRYHFLLQYYLKDEGINLSWVGTGRLNCSLDFTKADLDKVRAALVRAGQRMKDDGWWHTDPNLTPQYIKKRLVTEMVGAVLKKLARVAMIPV